VEALQQIAWSQNFSN